MAKRTGLGRGIGALIPTTEPAEDRPSDVFFPRAVATDDAPADAETDATPDDTPTVFASATHAGSISWAKSTR